MVARFHRQLKAAIKCHESGRWIERLPAVLLGIRAAWKEDVQTTAAELVYGQTMRLPGQFLSQSVTSEGDNAADFVVRLRKQFEELRPVDGARHGERRPFIFKELAKAEQVFVRRDGPKTLLQAPYEGPAMPFSTVRRGRGEVRAINIRKGKQQER